MASKRHQRRKCCEGKKRHETFAKAGKAARVMRRRHNQYLHPYKCPHCHKYHVGHYRAGAKISDQEVKSHADARRREEKPE